MAKAIATIVCPTCGKEYTVSTFKPSRQEANSWVEWIKSQERECKECYLQSVRKRREEESKQAIADSATNPYGVDVNALNLGGSDKQNEWAKSIIARFIGDHSVRTIVHLVSENACRMYGVAWDNAGIKSLLGETKEAVLEAIGTAIKNLSARNVIDYRDCLYHAIAESVVEAKKQVEVSK